MTQYQRDLARHVLLARQGGNGNHLGGGVPDPFPASSSADSSASSMPTASPPTPDPAPSRHSSTSSSVQSTTPPPVVRTSTTSDSTPTSSAPTSKTSSTTAITTTSSTTSSSTRSTSSTARPTTSTARSSVNTNQSTYTSSYVDILPTDTDSTGIATATAPAASAASGVSAGSIVGAVAGTLIGLGILGFLIAFILRRYRQSRRRAMRDSDFGTFRRSAFVVPRSGAVTPDMAETDHNVAPSLNEPYIAYPTAAAQPPSQALAAATAATVASTGGGLQERPKYVYGQDPSLTSQQRQYDDNASDAHGGAYSSQPQVQNAYSTEAYGTYAKYEDVSNGGVPAGTGIYQDAQRAYQGQQGYDQGTYDASQYVSYDQLQHPGYGQQYAAYDYSQQHQAHTVAGAHTDAYGGI